MSQPICVQITHSRKYGIGYGSSTIINGVVGGAGGGGGGWGWGEGDGTHEGRIYKGAVMKQAPQVPSAFPDTFRTP